MVKPNKKALVGVVLQATPTSTATDSTPVRPPPPGYRVVCECSKRGEPITDDEWAFWFSRLRDDYRDMARAIVAKHEQDAATSQGSMKSDHVATAIRPILKGA